MRKLGNGTPRHGEAEPITYLETLTGGFRAVYRRGLYTWTGEGRTRREAYDAVAARMLGEVTATRRDELGGAA